MKTLTGKASELEIGKFSLRAKSLKRVLSILINVLFSFVANSVLSCRE